MGECKFWKGSVGLNILNDLRGKANAIDWNRDARKIYYVLFSIHGFAMKLQEVAKTRHDVFVGQLKKKRPIRYSSLYRMGRLCCDDKNALG